MQVGLADYAVTHDGNVMMASAGWSQVGFGPFASALAFIVKVPWDMANQQIAIHAELVDEDGQPVLVNQAPLALAPGCRYEWRISVDGEHRQDWNRGFYVRTQKNKSPDKT